METLGRTLCTRYAIGEGRHPVQASCPLAPAVPCSTELVLRCAWCVRDGRQTQDPYASHGICPAPLDEIRRQVGWPPAVRCRPQIDIHVWPHGFPDGLQITRCQCGEEL